VTKVATNWKDFYLQKVSKGSFDMVKVKIFSQNIVNELNRKGSSMGINIQFEDDHTIVFPDCKITFIQSKDDLYFVKKDLKEDHVKRELKIVAQGNGFILIDEKTNKKQFLKVLHDVVEYAFECLLTREFDEND
jgi:hypothetical protein